MKEAPSQLTSESSSYCIVKEDQVGGLFQFSESEPENVESRSTTKDNVIRKMYSTGQKEAVAKYARFHGIRTASYHFRVHHKNVSRSKWPKLKIPPA